STGDAGSRRSGDRSRGRGERTGGAGPLRPVGRPAGAGPPNRQPLARTRPGTGPHPGAVAPDQGRGGRRGVEQCSGHGTGPAQRATRPAVGGGGPVGGGGGVGRTLARRRAVVGPASPSTPGPIPGRRRDGSGLPAGSGRRPLVGRGGLRLM